MKAIPPTEFFKRGQSSIIEVVNLIRRTTSFSTGTNDNLFPDGDGDQSLSAERLIDYLSENRGLNEDEVAFTVFEELTAEVLLRSSCPDLHRCLKDQGWTGARYKRNEFDEIACLHALSNYYLRLHAHSSHSETSITPSSSRFNRSGSGPATGTMRTGSEAAHILDLIQPFCPDLLVNYLKNHPMNKGEKEPRCFSFTGACMLADISGFSKFSASQCSKGVKGLDLLREATSGFLGHFVQEVYSHGGDVVAFAGDALICVFESNRNRAVSAPPSPQRSPAVHQRSQGQSRLPFSMRPHSNLAEQAIQAIAEGDEDQEGEEEERKAADPDAADAVRNGRVFFAENIDGESEITAAEVPADVDDCCYRAMQCAHLLRFHKTDYLSAHIGVSYGEMKLALLGGHSGQWTYVLNGECVSQLGSCIDNAKSQEFAVTKECFDQAKAWEDMLVAWGEVHDSNQSPYGMVPHADALIKVQREVSLSGNKLIENIAVNNSLTHKLSNLGVPPSMNPPQPAITGNDSRSSLGRDAALQLLARSTTSRVFDTEGLLDNHDKTASGNHTNANQHEFAMSHSHSVESVGSYGAADDQDNVHLRRSSMRKVQSHKSKQQDEALIKSISPFVPRPVINAINSASLESLGELRQVTTMFLELVTYSPTVHTDPITLQPFFLLAQEVLHESGGFLRQFLVDDKGCVFIAMWGVPTYTHSNNSSRAVYCAAKITQNALELDHKCAIGITTGTVFCGSEGGPDRRDYAGIGSDVNIAARLMSKAPGRIFVDQNTYHNLTDSTKQLLEPGDELTLKGMPAPVRPWRYKNTEELPLLFAEDEGTTQNSILKSKIQKALGAELEKLCNSNKGTDAEELLDGVVMSRFVFVIGAPGLGKGHAARYYRLEARRHNLNVIHIVARSELRSMPYGLIQEIFYELVGREHFTTAVQKRVVLDKVLDELCSDLCSEQEKQDARFSMEVILGLAHVGDAKSFLEQAPVLLDQKSTTLRRDATIDELVDVVVEDYDDDDDGDGDEEDSVVAAAAAFNDQSASAFGLSQKHKQESRRKNDHTFYNVLGMLLRNQPTVIIIENAHHSDELSWDELLLLQQGTALHISVLLTMHASKIHTAMSGNSGSRVASVSRTPFPASSSAAAGDSTPLSMTPGMGPSRSNSAERGAVGVGGGGGKGGGGAVGEPSKEGASPTAAGNLLIPHPIKLQEAKALQAQQAHNQSQMGRSPRNLKAAEQHSSPRAARPHSSLRVAAAVPVQRSSPRYSSNLSVVSASSIRGSSSTSTRHSTAARSGNHAAALKELEEGVEIEGASGKDSCNSGNGSNSLGAEFVEDDKYCGVEEGGGGGGEEEDESMAAYAAPYYQIDNAPASWYMLLSDPNTVIIELGEIDRDEVRDMLLSTLEDCATCTDQLVDLVLEVSAGNAFWCQSIAKFISEQGSDKFFSAFACADSRQSSLKQLILVRFETALPLEAQLVLKVASIIGEEFNQRLLAAVVPTHVLGQLTTLINKITNKGFLKCISEYPDQFYRFPHPLIQTTLRELTTPRDAEPTHALVAEYIEVTYDENLRPFYPILAYHYRRAYQKRRPLTFKYEIKAADQAICVGAWSEGLQLLECAGETAKRTGELRLVMEVADAALADMTTACRSSGSSSMYNRFLFRKVESFAGEARIMTGFQEVKREAQQRLQELATAREQRRRVQQLQESKSQLLKMRSVSQALTWQPSYVAGRRASIGAAPFDLKSDAGTDAGAEQGCCVCTLS